MAGISMPYDFGFCITETTDGTLVGNGTQWPVAMTKDQFFEFYYRFRALTLSADATFVAPDGNAILNKSYPDLYVAGEYNDEDGVITYTGVTVETDYICGAHTTSIRILDSTTGFVVGFTIVLNFLVNQFATPDNTMVYLYAGNYYPKIVLDTQGATGDEWALNSLKGFYGTSESAGVFTLWGNSISLYSDGGSSVTGSLDYEPTLWWAYNPGSGGDIWDTTTGAQLRDPFSVQTWS